MATQLITAVFSLLPGALRGDGFREHCTSSPDAVSLWRICSRPEDSPFGVREILTYLFLTRDLNPLEARERIVYGVSAIVLDRNSRRFRLPGRVCEEDAGGLEEHCCPGRRGRRLGEEEIRGFLKWWHL